MGGCQLILKDAKNHTSDNLNIFTYPMTDFLTLNSIAV